MDTSFGGPHLTPSVLQLVSGLRCGSYNSVIPTHWLSAPWEVWKFHHSRQEVREACSWGSFWPSLYQNLSGNSPTLSRLPLVHVGPPARLSPTEVQTRSGHKTNIDCQSTPKLVQILLLPLHVACHPSIETHFIHLPPLSKAFCLLHAPPSQETFFLHLRKRECERKLERGFEEGRPSVKTDSQKLNPITVSHV